MEKIPWYQSAIVRQQIVALIAAVVGLLGLTTDVDIDATVAAVFGGIAAIVPVWTIVTRLFKANPPLTDTAARKEVEVQAKLEEAAGKAPVPKQSGFVRAGMLALILALSGAGIATLTLSGCSTLGVPVLEGWNERLAGGYSAVTAVRETTSIVLEGKVRAARAIADPEAQAKAIAAAKADAQNLQDQADKAREGLDIARTMRDVNFGDADARLTSTLRVLEALQAYLAKETP